MGDALIVIGLGYVGLPLSQEACRSGFQVTGFDVSTTVLDGLGAGHSHVDDLSDEEVVVMQSEGFTVTDDPSCIASSDVVVICVPTPLSDDGTPDLGAVAGAATSIGEHLRAGTLVVLESPQFTSWYQQGLNRKISGVVWLIR